jgi:hypothetical protein
MQPLSKKHWLSWTSGGGRAPSELQPASAKQAVKPIVEVGVVLTIYKNINAGRPAQ